MHVERFFKCNHCSHQFTSKTGEKQKRCPQVNCRRQTVALPDYWTIKRVFKCVCRRSTTTEAYGKESIDCTCGRKIDWQPKNNSIQRFFRCKSCKKNFESDAHRQTEIYCPYVGCKTKLYPLKSLTKYHGKLFGKYRCPDKSCNKTWSSAYAYDGYFQQCKTCKSKSYPHHLIEHKHDGKPGDKEHLSELCGKCQSGEFCRDAARNSCDSDDDDYLSTIMAGMSVGYRGRSRYHGSGYRRASYEDDDNYYY